ncbi:DMT family transporter [Desulfoluna butyratoxydans]|uniref:Eama domain n=1 Tax=Desulfoluna butyratoxydans TaxID=231438 RepID=A0A4V6ILK8_9BACT|nr:DMT family transporter [Desulfoluna butyratoxydans]VFQ45438.1 eama domain [Desulfoluna butyratoxydans]
MPNISSPSLRGYLFIFGAALLWGLLGPVSRYLFAAGVSLIEAGFFRALLTWIMFGTHAAAKRQMAAKKKDLPVLFAFGFVGISLFYAANMMAIDKGGAALASVLLYTAPFWVALFSFFLFGERMTLIKGIAMALAVAGVWGICLDGGPMAGESIATAVLWGLTAGICYSLYYIIGKMFSGTYAPYTLFFWILPTGILGLLPFVEFTPKTPVIWFQLLLLAFFSYSANSFYYLGLRTLAPTRAVLTATLEPVVATFFAWLLWNETLGVLGYGGSVLILTGVLLTILAPER